MSGSSTATEADQLGALLAATARGDRQAFAEVYRLSSARLFGVALRITRRRETAEEVLQEAFLSIWKRAGQYRPERGQAISWMTAIARHRAIDRLRSQNREPATPAALDDLPELGAEALDGAAPQAPAREDLHGCLEQLQTAQKNSILLAYYYGLTHEELSTKLDAPLGTVKSWVRRGLIQLKECLDQ